LWCNRSGAHIFVNDNGAASYDTTTGFGTDIFVSNEQSPFTTPAGYKPMGPVSVVAFACQTGATGTAHVFARAW
jgi:hypothetical protein